MLKLASSSQAAASGYALLSTNGSVRPGLVTLTLSETSNLAIRSGIEDDLDLAEGPTGDITSFALNCDVDNPATPYQNCSIGHTQVSPNTTLSVTAPVTLGQDSIRYGFVLRSRRNNTCARDRRNSRA